MLYPDPHTRFKRKYSPRFNFKHLLVQSQNDKNLIFDYTVKIANHPTPHSIGGSATCPDCEFKKLEFCDGWIIIYEVQEQSIEFVNFYRKKVV